MCIFFTSTMAAPSSKMIHSLPSSRPSTKLPLKANKTNFYQVTFCPRWYDLVSLNASMTWKKIMITLVSVPFEK